MVHINDMALWQALRLECDDTAVYGLTFSTGREPDAAVASGALHSACLEQLRGYFSGTVREFTVPIRLHGTPFQRAVLSAAREIPYGSTCSYSELARRCGRPRAVRAVAAALARNPVLILVPCHRVRGQDGSLRGYAGGLARKAALLAVEQR